MTKISILSISNSFGVNLQKYASQIAEANGLELDIFVLYIGGCSLETHCNNIKNNAPNYDLYKNGQIIKGSVSIKEVLCSQCWDYVITQQVSYLSSKYDSFFPYIEDIFKYIKDNAKYKQLGLQETWEYGPTFVKNDGKTLTSLESDNMYFEISDAYQKVMKRLDLDILIDSGHVINKATKHFNKDFHVKDGYHLNDAGCYLIGANLVMAMFMKKINNVYVPDSLSNEECEEYLKFINNRE